MAEQPEFDPRYDPAFQRGYEGAPGGPRSGIGRRRAAASSPAAADEQSLERDPREPGVRPFAGIQPAAAEAAAPEPVALAPQAAPLRAPWRNPFAVATAVLGIVVLCGGIWIVQGSFATFGEPNALRSELDYWAAQSGIFAGPVAIALGIAILAGVLLHGAAYWARRPEPVDED